MNTRKYVIIILLFLFQFVVSQSLHSQYENAVRHNELMQGILVDAGGHKLHLNVQGNGSLSVIFENGSGDFSFIWSLVQPEVAKFTKAVSYDRAGYAWSEPGPIY